MMQCDSLDGGAASRRSRGESLFRGRLDDDGGQNFHDAVEKKIGALLAIGTWYTSCTRSRVVLSAESTEVAGVDARPQYPDQSQSSRAARPRKTRRGR